MGWELSTWLALGRSFQLLGFLAATSMHGYLTIRVYAGRLGLSNHMVALELLACALTGYSTLALILQNTGQRSKRTSWLTGFAVCDVFFCGVVLGIITTLARAGLPTHCAGMTRTDFRRGDEPDSPPPGYTTIRFSDERPGHRGMLDEFCGLDRSYYVIATALVFSYIFTITVTTLSIFEKRYTKNTKVNELLSSLERAEDINLKIIESPSPLRETARANLPPPQPPSEGVLTRNPSLRSNFTTATSSASSQAGLYGGPSIPPRRSIGGHPPPPIPQRPLATTSPSANPGIGFVPVPLDEDSAEEALVADGMQHQQYHQQTHPSHHRRHSSRDDHHHHHPSLSSFPRMPMLSEEDQHQSAADSALVSDGMRPSEPTLPPYHPGSRRMSGHAGESNEMRLSQYVKGQTRAQEMKDSGRF
ncbi:hypothetical protein C8A03DRAFT_39921 [Achaetomium macrosporum]|uniref:Uncharacterized protein n=1 Tax=Achaetomium macrosporum TaxID=79813 RepID=A0AAN7CJG4_9PEZI|nr:hypothetical protein C8A03DRAFT_39921 [Achaetomium macrosporum]